MTVQSFTFNPFMTNCFVAHDEGEAVVVDASSHTEAEHRKLIGYVEEQGLEVRHLLLTHGHIDHIFGCRYLSDHFGLPWQMHRADLPLITRSKEQAVFFGVALEEPPRPETFLEEGDVVRFGGVELQVLFTPGHSPGHVCFFDAASRKVLSGDVLFQGSIGRTDLPGGSMPQLMESIFQQLVPLGDDVEVYCGHGPSTTIGRERKTNPFLQDAA